MTDVIVIGGPNGAGKTTAASVLLPEMLHVREFVNADEIARGLSPFNVEGAAFAAGRVMLNRMRQLIENETSFAFETTCSGISHHRLLQQCKTKGWRVTVIYLWLPSMDMAFDRVARRVLAGGHDIPSATIARRYRAGMVNLLRYYLPLADIAAIYDNSDEGRTLIAEKSAGGNAEPRNVDLWHRLNASAASAR
jgi:predicted ABC-type ATPase